MDEIKCSNPKITQTKWYHASYMSVKQNHLYSINLPCHQSAINFPQLQNPKSNGPILLMWSQGKHTPHWKVHNQQTFWKPSKSESLTSQL